MSINEKKISVLVDNNLVISSFNLSSTTCDIFRFRMRNFVFFYQVHVVVQRWQIFSLVIFRLVVQSSNQILSNLRFVVLSNSFVDQFLYLEKLIFKDIAFYFDCFRVIKSKTTIKIFVDKDKFQLSDENDWMYASNKR